MKTRKKFPELDPRTTAPPRGALAKIPGRSQLHKREKSSVLHLVRSPGFPDPSLYYFPLRRLLTTHRSIPEEAKPFSVIGPYIYIRGRGVPAIRQLFLGQATLRTEIKEAASRLSSAPRGLPLVSLGDKVFRRSFITGGLCFQLTRCASAEIARG